MVIRESEAVLRDTIPANFRVSPTAINCVSAVVRPLE